MPALLRRLLERSKQKVDRSAAGSAVPAGIDPSEHQGPTAHERTLMRRRLRALRRRREALTRDVGGLDGAARELEQLDAEARALRQALDEKKTLDELLASGTSARCSGCGELMGKREAFCTNCGAKTPHASVPEQAGPHPPAGRTSHATAQTAVITGASSGRSPSPPAR